MAWTRTDPRRSMGHQQDQQRWAAEELGESSKASLRHRSILASFVGTDIGRKSSSPPTLVSTWPRQRRPQDDRLSDFVATRSTLWSARRTSPWTVSAIRRTYGGTSGTHGRGCARVDHVAQLPEDDSYHPRRGCAVGPSGGRPVGAGHPSMTQDLDMGWGVLSFARCRCLGSGATGRLG